MIAIVIATYNEANSIAILLNQLSNYDVIVVDDNSPDGTADIARKFRNATVIVPPERLGIAMSYKLGFIEALLLEPEYVIQMDAGLTHDPKDIEGMLSLARRRILGLVYGSRFSSRIELKGFRSLISLGGAFLMRLRGIKMSDATCGFRCWNPNVLKDVVVRDWMSKGFAFQLETANLVSKLYGNCTMRGYPIEYKLTNSSFNRKILFEALKVYIRLPIHVR